MSEKQNNPYMNLCPYCGEFICTKCAEIENKLSELCGCDDCNHNQGRLLKCHKEHLEKYDHSLLLRADMRADRIAAEMAAENQRLREVLERVRMLSLSDVPGVTVFMPVQMMTEIDAALSGEVVE